jgi:zinc protease
MGLLREVSKYNKSRKFIDYEQQELVDMSPEDFKAVINKFMKETDMVYLIVGDKETQFEDVKKLKGKVMELNTMGEPLE